MKQIDYLKLIATGRKSTNYVRPSDTDDALTGLIGYGFIASLIFTFAAAVLASFLGNELDMEAVAKPLAFTIIPGALFLIGSIFIGGAPKLARYCMLAVTSVSIVAAPMLLMSEGVHVWYLYVPPFVYTFFVGLGAADQMWRT